MTVWQIQFCFCRVCGHRWIGSVPDDNLTLECPSCRLMTGGVFTRRIIEGLIAYYYCEVSIGKLADIIGLDIYETRRVVKELNLLPKCNDEEKRYDRLTARNI